MKTLPRKIADLDATLVELPPEQLSVVYDLNTMIAEGREYRVGVLINGNRLEFAVEGRVFSVSLTQITTQAIERIHNELEAETALEDELQPKVG